MICKCFYLVFLDYPLVASSISFFLKEFASVFDTKDQRQTESIQLLQGQLENVTQLVLNLSVRVSQLQIEVNTKLRAQSIHIHTVEGGRGLVH